MLIIFSTDTPGLTPGYKILNADKSEYAARTTEGITDLGGGTYAVTAADVDLAGRAVLWDTGEAIPHYAGESFSSVLITDDDHTAIADALLNRSLADGAGADEPEARTVRNALRSLRNKSSITGDLLAVTKEDDATTAWTARVETDAGAEPVTSIIPTS